MALAVTALLLAVTACSADDSYCDSVSGADLPAMLDLADFTDGEAVEQADAVARELQDAAPHEEVAGGWELVGAGISAARESMRNTGGDSFDAALQQELVTAIERRHRAEIALSQDLSERCGFDLYEAAAAARDG